MYEFHVLEPWNKVINVVTKTWNDLKPPKTVFSLSGGNW